MADEAIRGRFLWHELMSKDPEAGQKSYTELVGWGTQTEDPGTGPYTMFTFGESPMAGVMQLPEEAEQMGAPTHWLLYVGVPDADATVAQAKELGGQAYMEPFDVPTVGRIAVIADPQGAALGVFTPLEAPPESEAGRADFVWHELATSGYEAAIGFYQQLFGWEKTEAVDMGEGNIYQMYGRGSSDSLGGMLNKPPEMPVSAWMMYIEVENVDAAATRIPELGGQVLNGPMEVPGGGRILQGMDPQGGMFAFHTAPAG